MRTPRERWQARAEARLPRRADRVGRNAAITAEYARWYLRRQELFKWAGMAAFASHHVGMAFRSTALRMLIPDLDRIRKINNLIYRDIGWAHLAYETEGIAAIEEALRPNPPRPTRAPRAAPPIMLEAFRAIERGRRQIAAGHERAGWRIVWHGNFLLLKHEQFDTVQPQFDQLSRGFSHLFSLATSMEFDASDHALPWHRLRQRWFALFMWTRGLLVLIRTRSTPDITNREHRWFWISKWLLPRWRSVDTKDGWLTERMEELEVGLPAGAFAHSALLDAPCVEPA